MIVVLAWVVAVLATLFIVWYSLGRFAVALEQVSAREAALSSPKRLKRRDDDQKKNSSASESRSAEVGLYGVDLRSGYVLVDVADAVAVDQAPAAWIAPEDMPHLKLMPGGKTAEFPRVLVGAAA